MKAAIRSHHSRRGQALIGLVIVIAIILGMTYYFAVGKRDSAGNTGGVYSSALNDANMTACSSYSGQIHAAIMQYKQDNGSNPPDLKSLSKYGVVNDMISPPCNFGYDPQTGTLYPPGQTPPVATQATNPASSNDGISMSTSQPAAAPSNDRPGSTYIAPMAGTVGIHVPNSDNSGGGGRGGGEGN